MQTTLKLHFYDNSESKLQELNELLNDYGTSFTEEKKPLKNDKIQKLLHINVNEELLQEYKRVGTSNAGRPVKKIDYDMIVKLRQDGLPNDIICKQLDISKSLFYKSIVTSIDKLDVGTRVEYHPLVAEEWSKATVQLDSRGTKYLLGDDRIEDYSRKSDVIRKIE